MHIGVKRLAVKHLGAMATFTIGGKTYDADSGLSVSYEGQKNMSNDDTLTPPDTSGVMDGADVVIVPRRTWDSIRRVQDNLIAAMKRLSQDNLGGLSSHQVLTGVRDLCQDMEEFLEHHMEKFNATDITYKQMRRKAQSGIDWSERLLKKIE